MAGGASEPGRSVTSKVLSILEVFETHLRPLSQGQIVELTGLPQSTAHRLLSELVTWGALYRDDNGRYQVGMRLWELGQHAGRQLRELSRPFIQDLHSLTRETAQLAIRDGSDALYIERVYSSKRVPRASRVGGRLPLHATAVGKVLLAYEEDWVREAILQHGLRAVSSRTHVDPGRLAEELATVKEQGFATTTEEVRAGVCSIAVPVFHRDGPVGASIGLVMASANSGNMTRHLQTLRGVSRQIELATDHIPLSTILRFMAPGGK